MRSILEHAWAEIEHEVVYKSKIQYPDSIKRSFAMLAGVLELLDGQFEILRDQREKIVESHRKSYANRKEGNAPLDSARILAFFECHFPEGLSWRKAAAGGAPFPARIEAKCLAALKILSITTAKQLTAIIKTDRFRKSVKLFADRQGVSELEVSHLALAVLAIATKDVDVAREFFPDIEADPAFSECLTRLERKLRTTPPKRRKT